MDPDRLRLYSLLINISWVLAAIAATTFPVLYSFSKWNRSTLGRVMMANAVVTAFLVDLIVVTRLQLLPTEVNLILYLLGFIAFTCTKTGMSIMMWTLNHRKENKDERV